MSMQVAKEQTAVPSVSERPGYFPVSGGHLYTVLHEVAQPVARVLLVGPSASERHLSYRPWVQWARYLAARNIEVLRYDYRGVGESTGVFEEMTFDHWTDDVASLATWLKDRGREVPLVLHGLELGGLLAARAFDGGQGDALLLWSAAANANKMLRSALLRWIGPQQMMKPVSERTPPSYYFQLLEQGEFVEVEGYRLSPQLWRESFNFDFPPAMVPPNDPVEHYKKPVHIATLGKNAAPLVKGAVAGYDENKNFDWLFTINYRWISGSLSLPLVTA
jgi:hypothetical protein